LPRIEWPPEVNVLPRVPQRSEQALMLRTQRDSGASARNKSDCEGLQVTVTECGPQLTVTERVPRTQRDSESEARSERDSEASAESESEPEEHSVRSYLLPAA